MRGIARKLYSFTNQFPASFARQPSCSWCQAALAMSPASAGSLVGGLGVMAVDPIAVGL
jgi:hypothetical protein